MNVAFDPWIPVMNVIGERELASLFSVLVEGERFSDLAVRPHERVALMRLILCVTHAALNGPKDYKEWCEVPKRLPGSAIIYLDEWRDSFELFHPTSPWLQVTGLSKNDPGKACLNNISDWTPVSKLDFSLASGNNTTLFDHAGMEGNREIALQDTILSMITFQNFSLGGLISQVFWNGKQTGKSSKDAPCAPASMIHTLLRGKDLLDTICLNLTTHEDVSRYYPHQKFGKPIWELMPTSFVDKPAIENATETYAGRLIPVARLIWIHPAGKKMLLGNGLPYPTFTDEFPAEPTSTIVVKKVNKGEVHALLSYRPDRALWRELAALIVKRRAGEPGGPILLNALQEGEACDLIVSALARNQASIVDTCESVFHVTARLRSNSGIENFDAEVHKAELLASRLGWAIEVYRKEIDGGWEDRLKWSGPKKAALKVKLHSIATTNYWTMVEKKLALLMAHIETIDTDDAVLTRKSWRKMLYEAACDAYRIACAHATPRQMRAFTKGWHKLTSKRDQPATNSEG